MSVSNQTPYISHTANGQTTVFAFAFYVINASDLQVSINNTIIETGYSVTGVGNPRGGAVVFKTPPARNTRVFIERAVPTERLTDYQDNGDLLADTLNKDFDRLWMAIQRTFLYVRRTLRVPEMSVVQLPEAAERANKLLAFNGSGQPITVAPPADTATEVMIELAKPHGAKKIGFGSSTVYNTLVAHGVTTSSLGIGFTTAAAANLSTNHSDAFQAMLDTVQNIVVDTIINLGATVYTRLTRQQIQCTGIGEIRPVGNAMSAAVMLAINSQYCLLHRCYFTNPLLLKSASGDRQGAVDIRADYCTIENSTFINQLNAVTASSTYDAAYIKVLNNYFIDCLGAGGGTGSSSAAGEDRGDAVTLWTRSAIISGNHATCKAGQDARLAFHCEHPVGEAAWRGDGWHHIMTNNYAYGTFRRHFAFEGITNGISYGNVSAGGATWWCEAYIQCTNVYANNILRYTRTAAETPGSTWNPIRGAIAVMNYNENVTIDSMAVFSDDAVGHGVVTGTTTGAHRVRFRGTVQGNGKSGNYGTYLVRPALFILDGFRCQKFVLPVFFTSGSVTVNGTVYPTDISVLKSYFNTEGCNTVSCVANTSGAGGAIRIDGLTIHGDINMIANVANLDVLSVNGVNAAPSQFMLHAYQTKVALAVTNCVNSSDKRTALRINTGTTGTVGNIDFEFSGNVGFINAFYYAEDTLSNAGSRLNTYGRYKGRIVQTHNATYISSGSAASAAWQRISISANINPA